MSSIVLLAQIKYICSSQSAQNELE